MIITDAIQTTDGLAVRIDAQPARIDLTKKSLLDLGYARLETEDGGDYPVMEHLPADPADGRGAMDLPGFTTDPVAVVLARRFWRASNAATFTPGPVPIPTPAQAVAELENPRAWAKGT